MLDPLRRFLRTETAGGLVLVGCAVVAMFLANSSMAGVYRGVLAHPLGFAIASLSVTEPTRLWINDGLMVGFFLLVGLELKREVMHGHLASGRQALLPAFAALGGMLVPAGLYLAATAGHAEAWRGWAVPTATDIAFALGVLALLGTRVPVALKVLLLSIAICDDLGAILVIAVYYTESLYWPAVGLAVLIAFALAVCGRLRIRHGFVYVSLGVALWLCVLKSGVHPTLTGIILAAGIPSGGSDGAPSVLRRWEQVLHPWVAFGVVPLFVLANAGVALTGLRWVDLLAPVSRGVYVALVVGKPLGVFASMWLATRLRWASLPADVGWRQVFGLSVLCGIGFTMSVFIASLAFPVGGADAIQAVDRAKLGILSASLCSAVGGYVVLASVRRRGGAGASG